MSNKRQQVDHSIADRLGTNTLTSACQPCNERGNGITPASSSVAVDRSEVMHSQADSENYLYIGAVSLRCSYNFKSDQSLVR